MISDNLPNGYTITQCGSLQYITNVNGKIVSEGYHEFKIYDVGDGRRAIIASLGAMERILLPPGDIDASFIPSKAEFHEISYDKKIRHFITSTGAMEHILNPNTGEESQKGYHSYFMKKEELWGRTGAREERVMLSLTTTPPVTYITDNTG